MVALALALLILAPQSPQAPPPTPAAPPVEAPTPEVQPTAPEPLPAAAPPPTAPRPPPPTTSSVAAEDRIGLRDGGMLLGRIVEVQKNNYVTIVVSQTGENRTISWALIDAYQIAGQPEQIASRGKPTIAELAAESDSIERQKNIGLGLAYAGYVSTVISLGLWTAYPFLPDEQSRDSMLVTAAVSTGVTVGLLTSGGVLFFKARQRRRRLREVQVAGQWGSGGGGFQLRGRF